MPNRVTEPLIQIKTTAFLTEELRGKSSQIKPLAPILIVLLFSPITWGQTPNKNEHTNLEKATTCRQLPYKKGCHNAGLGLILGINSTPFSWGASFKYGYFIFDRLLPAGVAEFTLFDGQSQYELGADLSYFIGPVFGFIIAPGYSLRYLAIRGGNKDDNMAHGLVFYLAIRIKHHFTIGAEFFFNFQKNSVDKNEESRIIFPAVKYSF